MKKFYLLFMMVSFTVALFAQSARPTMTMQQAKNIKITEAYNPKVTPILKQTAALPTQGMRGLVTPANIIGTTYQEQQTNYNQRNKIAVFPDGTASVVWMTAPRNGNSLRGTGYNYFDGSQWVNASDDIQRIENVRTGWPCMASVGTNGEIVIAHNGDDALVINVRPQKGTGNWTQTTLAGPAVLDSNGANPSTALLWPDIATNGNTIHLVAVTESNEGYLYDGINRCLLYYRGTYDETNNTITWENPRKVFNATPEMYTYFGADCYTIAAKGNTVAILYMTKSQVARIWKSTDNGLNFNTITLFDSPWAHDYDLYSEYDPSIEVDTNTINFIPNEISTIAIGDDGKVHVAFDLYRCKWGGWTPSSQNPMDTVIGWTYWPNWNYQIVYWNEDMPVFVGRTALDVDTLAANGYTTFGLLDLDGDDTARYYNFDYYADNIRGSIVSYPQITVDGSNVYMVYCGMLEYPFLGTNNQSIPQLHGIFGVRSTDGGQSWNNGTSWLSFGKDIQYAENWGTDSVGLVIDYDAIFPAMSKKVVNGKLVIDWMTDYFGDIVGSGVFTNMTWVMARTIAADSIGVYNNVEEIRQGLWIDPMGIADNTLQGMKLYPNPATDNLSVAISSSENASADLTIVNLMGQVVYSENVALNEGNNLLNVSVSNLTSGVYMINIRTNKGTSTQKLIVK